MSGPLDRETPSGKTLSGKTLSGKTLSGRTLEIATTPHVTAGHSVEAIMRSVVLALLPVTAFAVYTFGLAALLTVGTAVATALLAEHLACRLRGLPSTVPDWSVAITGLLYGLTLPPGLPLWMVVVGALVAVWVGKSFFGGLGSNPFNPALVGRAVLQAAFPIPMTSWVEAMAPDRWTRLPSSTLTFPLAQPVYDVLSGATPLSAWKFQHQAAATADLLLGTTSGSAGETSALLILVGGAWLAARRMLDWRIPVAILGTVAALSGALWLVDPAAYASPAFMLLSGGLMLGAVFMATDMVGSPMTGLGVLLYGALIGVLVVVIRTWGGMPEGVMYAVLLANAVTPHLDTLIKTRVYGTGRREAA